MTPSTTGVSRSRLAVQNMTDEERLAHFAALRDSSNPHDAEEAMRLAEGLVQRYMPLVGNVLRKWRERMPAGLRMIGFDDLEAAGMRGLWEALLKYDPQQEKHFAPFATARISWVVSAEVRNADLLKVKARREVQRMWRAVSSLEKSLGREATEDEAARAAGVSVARYRELRGWERRSITATLTEPLAMYLCGTEGDPLERLCVAEEALEELGEDDREISEAAQEIGVAVESIKGYFDLFELEQIESAA